MFVVAGFVYSILCGIFAAVESNTLCCFAENHIIINDFERKREILWWVRLFRSMVSVKEMSERHCVMEVLGAINWTRSLVEELVGKVWVSPSCANIGSKGTVIIEKKVSS